MSKTLWEAAFAYAAYRRLALQDFFKRAPLLYIGLLMAFGAGYYLCKEPFLLPGGLLLMVIAWPLKKYWPCFFFGLLWAALICPPLKPPPSGYGQAYFKIERIGSATGFRQGLLYKGTISRFTCDGKIFKNIKAGMFLSKKIKGRPAAACDYMISGCLKIKRGRAYFKPCGHMQQVPHTYSLAEWRYGLQKKVKKHLRSKLPNHNAQDFLIALLCGDLTNDELRFCFNKTGLQHILAVSGMHFGILLLICKLFLRFFRNKTMLLLPLCVFYLLFIGAAPPIFRAFIMIFLSLFAEIIGRRNLAPNALGAALLLTVLLSPTQLFSAAFQLSFLASAALLIILPCVEELLGHVLKKRVSKAGFFLPSRIGYMIMIPLKSALALTLTINLALLPLIFWHFGQFSLLSIPYNLFFPLLTVAALFLLMAALVLDVIAPPVGSLLHLINSGYTGAILKIVQNAPKAWQFMWYAAEPPPFMILLYLFIIFAAAIIWRYKKELSAPLFMEAI